MSDYTATIGLEVHAELNTKSKMFCGCTNDPHHGEPNAHTCPVCLAHPGTLPTVNEEAIKKVLRFGYAVGATVATFSEFDRKNYFYPDIPKAYQISQYQFPFLTGGTVAGVTLTRVHLEEDTARSQHDKGTGSLVDFNRAGVPLMELVTEPVIHDGKTAAAFAKELQLLMRTLGISNANMERGEMRVEANISVSKTEALGTKVEVKNLNSFKVVEQAIAYEIERQTKLLKAGEQVLQETRGWDEAKARTFSQRSKETAKDYRYFPDPDIPKMRVDEHVAFAESRLAEKTENLPENKRVKYENLGLTSEQIETIIASPYLDQTYRELFEGKPDDAEFLKLSANYLVTDVVPLVQTASSDAALLSATHFAGLITLLRENQVSSRVAKDLLAEFATADADVAAVARERNLLQTSSADDLAPLIDALIAAHPGVVEEYRAGKTASLQFLVGQGMKQSRGTANPKLLAELLVKALNG